MVRRCIGVLAVTAAAFFTTVSLASALPWPLSPDVTINNPRDGTALNGSPDTFSGAGGSTNIFSWGWTIYIQISDYSGSGTGHFSPGFIRAYGYADVELLNPSELGDWSVGKYDMTRIDGITQVPNGTPLPDGRYTERACQQRQVIEDNCYPDDGDYAVYSSFFVDTHAPDTVIDAQTPSATITNQTNRRFTFHIDDPTPSSGVDNYLCRVDGGPAQDCNLDTGQVDHPDWYPDGYPTGDLAEGHHTFTVQASDAAFNLDPTPAEADWYIDTTKPTISLTTPSSGQRFLLGQNVPPDYTCDDPVSNGYASGIASCTATPLQTDHLGNFSFTVTAVDRAGNTTTLTRSYAVDPVQYGGSVTSSDPIAYYRLGDPLGSDTMADSSGHGHDGEYKNGIALRRPAAIACERRPHPPAACETSADPQDWAAFLPARDGYGFANGIDAPQSAYTIEAWVKPADGGDMSIAGQGGGGQLFITGRRLALRQTQDTIVAPGPNLPIGEWSHVAATWDGHTTRLFVNGVEVASSANANKPPSGSSTFYVGYGDQAPWFHGDLDEVAYYGSALPASVFGAHHEVGTAFDPPSPPGGPDIARPSVDPVAPANGGLYAPGKTPHADFSCDDPDGASDVASCTATVDGNPIADGDPLPDSPGSHTFTVTAVDQGGITYVHTHTYTVKPFADIYRSDAPIAYFRLGDAHDTMADASGNGNDGAYKNDQESGPVGIAGDGDHARRFYGAGGYGSVNGIAAPRFQSTLEAWVNPDDTRDASIAGHGDGGELFIRGGHFAYRHMDQTVTADVGPNPGHFTQVVGVWDGVTLSIYVDGRRHGSVEATKRPSSVSTFYVGYGELEPWFKGSIDEVAYYDTALTSGRVYQHYLADPPPTVLGTATTPPQSTTTTSARPTRPSTTPQTTVKTGVTKTTATTTPAVTVARCVVPSLHGLTVTRARRALAKAHCALGATSRRRSSRRNRGRVLSQSVRAGRTGAAGRTVRITVGR